MRFYAIELQSATIKLQPSYHYHALFLFFFITNNHALLLIQVISNYYDYYQIKVYHLKFIK